MSGDERPEFALERGRVTFLGVELLAAPGVLVPRAETELLAQTAVAAVQEAAAAAPRVIDMCCGAGNLACAVAVQVPAVEVWASDLTDDCVALSRRNVAQLGLEGRVEVRQGDLFAPLIGRGLEGTIDVIVCNPPYISQAKLAGERAELLAHEPREAFDGGPYGLSIHQRVLREALAFLKPGGRLLFEIGLGQDRQLAQLAARTRGYEGAEPVRNAAGEIRVISLRTLGVQPHGHGIA